MTTRHDLTDIFSTSLSDIGKSVTKKAVKPTWHEHPNHKLHDQIVAHYAPLIEAAIRNSVHGIHEAIAEAKRKASNAKNATAKSELEKSGIEDAMASIKNNITFASQDAITALRNILADSYLAGAHVGQVLVGGGAKIAQGLEGAATAMDWNAWKPGWLQAAGNVKDGGLAALLDQADATIVGINGTVLTRLGNVLSDGIAAGDSVQTISQNMSDFSMSPERSFVIANTETARSMTSATLSTYDTNGVESWEWLSEDDDKVCPECEDNNGKTFSTQDSSTDQPPLHPTCFPAGTLVSSPKMIGSVSRWFDGELIEIITTSGEFISVTPNHPILTNQGWIAAGLIHEGSDVIRCIDIERVILAVDPDNYYSPTVIEDVVESFVGSFGVTTSSVPTTAIDFHGDGIDSEVCVVGSNSLLGNNDETVATKHLYHFPFPVANVGVTVGLDSLGDFASNVERDGFSSDRIVSSFGKSRSFFGRGVSHSDNHGFTTAARNNTSFKKSASNDVTVDAEFARQGKFALPLDVSINDFRGNVKTYATNSDATVLEGTIKTRETDTGDGLNLLEILAGLVKTDRVVSCRRVKFSGHVYNLQTTIGWYVANSIIVHNCRCATLPVITGIQDNAQPTLDSSDDSEE